MWVCGEPQVAMARPWMVASHHGEYAFGAPKLPMTLEAIALHFIDALDAKLIGTLQLFQSEAAIDDGWTQYHPNHGRKFFRGRDGSPS